MNKSHKTLFIFLIVLLLSYNLSESFLTIYCHTFCKETIGIIVIRAIPLLILLLCYLTNIRFSSKLSINYLYLFISIIGFLIAKTHILFYLYLLIDHVDNSFLLIMYITSALFMVLAFLRNFKMKEGKIVFLFLIVPIFLILQLIFEMKTFGISPPYSYTNPDRYEFVRYHYFSAKEFSYLPDRIPEDATNIIFHYNSYSLFSQDEDLYLEYDSPSIPNNEHHIKYEITIPSKEKSEVE